MNATTMNSTCMTSLQTLPQLEALPLPPLNGHFEARHDLLDWRSGDSTFRDPNYFTRWKLAEEELTKSRAEIERLQARLEASFDYPKSELAPSQEHPEIIGVTAGIKQVLRKIEQVAVAECAVLITGETGTGKELIARDIHRLSARSDRKMAIVNCAALPSALVE